MPSLSASSPPSIALVLPGVLEEGTNLRSMQSPQRVTYPLLVCLAMSCRKKALGPASEGLQEFVWSLKA